MKGGWGTNCAVHTTPDIPTTNPQYTCHILVSDTLYTRARTTTHTQHAARIANAPGTTRPKWVEGGVGYKLRCTHDTRHPDHQPAIYMSYTRVRHVVYANANHHTHPTRSTHRERTWDFGWTTDRLNTSPKKTEKCPHFFFDESRFRCVLGRLPRTQRHNF